MSRFKPTRAGIIGIWDYTEQVFAFADGRLVLRGVNASGKTKALEVLVPFVLDGSIDARRLDPFSGKERNMRSNLLFGDRKVGHAYCWLELSRGEEHVSVGVGMRAQERNNRVDTWYFVADGRVGEDLHLLGPDRVPQSRRALREQLGGACVFDRLEDHRAAVDRRLFGLGTERYQAMLELVLTLRRPQIAKNLDPERLSDVLSEGLRTVDRDLLRASADAFSDLEEHQRRLAELERARAAVTELESVWRTYLRAHGQHRVGVVQEAQAAVSEANAAYEQAEQDIRRYREARDRALAELREHEADLAKAREQVRALEQSEVYRSQGQLDDARDKVTLASRALQTARSNQQSASQRLSREEEELTRAQQRLERSQDLVAEAERSLRAHLSLVGLPAESLESQEIRGGLAARRESVRAVLEVVAEVERHQAELRRAERTLQQAMARAEEAAVALRRAEAALEQALEDVAEALRGWHEALPPPLAEVLPLDPLLALLTGPDEALAREVGEALRPLREDTLRELTGLDHRMDAVVEEIRVVDADMERIRAQRDDAPPTPATRVDLREDRVGAPLWRLVRFRERVSPEDQAGLEGALLASGLLDAWVDPDAPPRLRQDTHLVPTPAVQGPTLAELLEPEEQEEVPMERVEALLHSVSVQTAGISVSPDGSFSLGPLAGAFVPDRARYIGATARQQHREERLAGLSEQRELLEAERGSLDAGRQRCQERLRQLRHSVDALPGTRAVREARARARGARIKAEVEDEARARAASERDAQARALRGVQHQLRQVAREHGVPSEPEEVRTLGERLGHAERALDEVVAKRSRAQELAGLEELARTRRDEAHEDDQRCTREAGEAENDHLAASARLETLTSTLGVEVAEVLARLEAAKGRAASIDERRRQASKRATEAREGETTKVGEQNGLSKQMPGLEAALAHAVGALAPYDTPSVLELLDMEPDGGLAQRVAVAVEGAVSNPAQLASTGTRLENRLATLDEDLGDHYHQERSQAAGLTMVELHDESGGYGVTAFRRTLERRLQLVRDLLSETEQRLFEDQLLRALSTQLKERMDETHDLVRSMNQAMGAVQVAGKWRMGIGWKATSSADADQKELLELLRHSSEFLSPDRLARLRAILRREVQHSRQDRADRKYLDILEEALDYRRWHRFELSLTGADGSTSKLTGARHGRLSGGEKAATLHLPLFAAAHAHFSAARLPCPRLIALDEAFAGIDGQGVPELLRLALAFDLDFMITGYDLWVAEPFLPSVMHYDLAHDAGDHVVSAWPILWNGKALVDGEEP